MRVRLIRTTDPHTQLVPGAEGTVVQVDDLGTVHVRWDDGGTLGLIPGVDKWDDLCTLCGKVLVPGCCDTTDLYADMPVCGTSLLADNIDADPTIDDPKETQDQ